MSTSPAATMKSWLLTMSRRVWLPSSSRDVEEKMHTMEIRISIKTMIHTTLSPSICSK